MKTFTKHSPYAIGVMDSGVGGLTVVKEVMRQLPHETIYYFGDTLRCPYGPRSTEEVCAFTDEIIDYLLQFPLKAILIACNTATAAALPILQKRLSIPVLGVIEPGARAAIQVSKQRHIGVIGTQGTIRSGAYERALKAIHPESTVTSLACPAFVPLVEKGMHRSDQAKKVVREVLQPLKRTGLDTLILGCTHYPLLNHFIAAEMGDRVTTISSAAETAVELNTILESGRFMASFTRQPQHRFFVTGSPSLFAKIGEEWLGMQLQVEQVKLYKLKQITGS